MDLPAGLLDLLYPPSPCFVATLVPDGSPQMTQTWVDDDGAGRIRINTVAGSQNPWYGGRDQTRLVVSIEADRVHSPQG